MIHYRPFLGLLASSAFTIVSSVPENNTIRSNPVRRDRTFADVDVWNSTDAAVDNTRAVYWMAIGR